MSVWNKYGQITKEGKIDANLQCTGPHVDYAGAHRIWSEEPAGDKHDIPAQAMIVKGRPMIVINGTPCAYLPEDWTQFLKQVRDRGPIPGNGRVIWTGTEFKVGIEILER
jgi:hypothetical protein